MLTAAALVACGCTSVRYLPGGRVEIDGNVYEPAPVAGPLHFESRVVPKIYLRDAGMRGHSIAIGAYTGP